MKFYDNPQREYQEEVALLEQEDEVYKLVLHNDDVNTFDFVIECLTQITQLKFFEISLWGNPKFRRTIFCVFW